MVSVAKPIQCNKPGTDWYRAIYFSYLVVTFNSTVAAAVTALVVILAVLIRQPIEPRAGTGPAPLAADQFPIVRQPIHK